MESTITPIDPIAFSIGTLDVRWYGILIGLGIAIAFFMAVREGKKRGLDSEVIADLLLWAVPISIVCARIYYVIFQWDYYSQNPGDIVKIWEGGIAIHGALIGAVATAVIFCRIKGISFWKLADIVAPSLLVGQAIGRWGNFMNQEAYGGEVSREFLESLFLPDWIINQMYIQGAYHHPTFLYESLWNFVGIFVLLGLRRVNLRRGEIFLSYLIWYSIGRFFVEGMRTDSLMLTEFLRIAQVMSLVLIVVSIAIMVFRRMKGYARERYLDS
ncbi:prolipoprotein diacylglyceryl transferase [Bacillus oleivorans]|uniref:Phosphatidylglycerol--prolipoprotein diacylglyceryl transferase n=1 Tax=Bacillus oleivorans TaxID=1448271 RepID=A0A285CZW9_9BACI|nr:prolipoprotein diacylglyceryl transferase [Bacillus oleivorans]SNX72618.1 prolipoprotein diacylglyceryl transferase [Bacillus oleivorans]